MSTPYFYTWAKQNEASHFNVQKAQGVFLTTQDHDIIDLSSLSLQASFGHSPEQISKHIIKQIQSMPMASPKADFALKTQVTQELLDYMHLGPGKIFYTVSGAESVENALKIARQVKGQKKILARKKSYHGATLGALSVTGDWRNALHATVDEWTVRIPEPDDDPHCLETRKIVEKSPDQFAACIVETVTGANGVYVPPLTWWQGLSKICKDYGLLLILDEIVCGFERTGHSFGYMNWDLKPDIVTMAKAISGGLFPFGAVWVKADIAKFYDNEILSCGLTNYAIPTGLAALKGVLELVKGPNFIKLRDENIQIFKRGLEQITQEVKNSSVRQIGLLANIDIPKTIAWEVFIKEKLYLMSFEKRIVIAPALNFPTELLEKTMKKLKDIILSYSK